MFANTKENDKNLIKMPIKNKTAEVAVFFLLHMKLLLLHFAIRVATFSHLLKEEFLFSNHGITSVNHCRFFVFRFCKFFMRYKN